MCEICEKIIADVPSECLGVFEEFRAEFEALAARAAVKLEAAQYIRVLPDSFNKEEQEAGVVEKARTIFGLVAMAGYLANSKLHHQDIVQNADQIYEFSGSVGWAVGHMMEVAIKN